MGNATIGPGHYAVIFTRQRTSADTGYGEMAAAMVARAKSMPGFLGIESYSQEDGSGVTISYWQDEASIKNWQQQPQHLAAQAKGKSEWYEYYDVRIAKIERAYRGGIKNGSDK